MKKNRLLSGALTILVACGLFMACKKDNNGNNNSSASITMKNSVFSNANLQIKTGTNVTWTNDDTTVHTVTANDSSFDSGNIQPGGSFSHQFNSTGTFMYHDKYHNMMTGAVVVSAASSGGY
ncbi:MAG: cupredoxin domain-containing protein [Bacteroidetes bacterium]|nr:cupredoxin domain-containing protein [Bacteroidota bacterium]